MPTVVLTSCLLLGWLQPQDPPSQSPDPQALAVVASVEKLLTDAIARAEPSVVTIARIKNESGAETLAVRGRRRTRVPPMFLEARDQRSADMWKLISLDNGAGVVIGDRGEILTLFHVVRGASELIVRATGNQQFPAEIIAADPRSDLAVLVPASSDGDEPPSLKPIKIGDSSGLRRGSFLIALGNSFNAARNGEASASWGILSNIARRLELPGDELYAPPPPTKPYGLVNLPTLLQLDTKLNLGMSGGAVINLKGELVGVTTMASSAAGFDAMAGYAVPMDKIIRRAIATLKEGREVEYGLLGLMADKKFSNFVSILTENSPAALGQLQVNDQIIAVNDMPVSDFYSLVLAVNIYPAGEAVRLKILRDDKPLERTVVLAKLAVEGEVIATNRPKPWRGLRVEYTSVTRRDPFNFPERALAGVKVLEVEDGSPASAAGLKPGQLIVRVGDDNIRSPREFADAVARHEGPVTLDTDLGQVTVK
jgi:serine protease Do